MAQSALAHSLETMALTQVAGSGPQMHGPFQLLCLPISPLISDALLGDPCCTSNLVSCFWIFPLAYILFP